MSRNNALYTNDYVSMTKGKTKQFVYINNSKASKMFKYTNRNTTNRNNTTQYK